MSQWNKVLNGVKPATPPVSPKKDLSDANRFGILSDENNNNGTSLSESKVQPRPPPIPITQPQPTAPTTELTPLKSSTKPKVSNLNSTSTTRSKRKAAHDPNVEGNMDIDETTTNTTCANTSTDDHTAVTEVTKNSAHRSSKSQPSASNESKTSTPQIQYGPGHNENGMKNVPQVEDSQTLGINVNMMATRKTPSTKPDVSRVPTVIEIENEQVTPTLTIKTYSARFEILPLDQNAINVPMIVKQVFRIFKKADRTTRLLPCTGIGANDDLDSIDQENLIPTEEHMLKKWTYNPRMIRNRLCFTLKLSSVASIKHMSDSVYPWMAKNSSFVKLDFLTANEIIGIGCITECHTQFYNRDKLKTFIQQEVQKHGFNGGMNMYVRNVWCGRGNNKVSTRAIVCEVGKEDRDLATRAMMKLRFAPHYATAKFIPFNRVFVPEEIMTNVIKANNYYIHQTRKKHIQGLKDINTIRTLNNGDKISLLKWLEGSTCNAQPTIKLFEHVEETKFGDVCVIFNAEHTQHVHQLLSNLKLHIQNAFIPEEVIFDDSQTFTSGVTDYTDQERSYADALRNYYAGSVNGDNSTVLSKRKTLYYGTSDANVAYAKINHLDNRNEETPPVQQQPQPNDNFVSKDDFDTTITSLQQSVDRSKNAQQQSVTHADLQTMQAHIDQKLAEQKVTQPIASVDTSKISKLIETQISARIQMVEAQFDKKLQEMSAKHAADLEALTLNLKNEFQTFRIERKQETADTMKIIQQTIQDALLKKSNSEVAASCEQVHDSGEKP